MVANLTRVMPMESNDVITVTTLSHDTNESTKAKNISVTTLSHDTNESTKATHMSATTLSHDTNESTKATNISVTTMNMSAAGADENGGNRRNINKATRAKDELKNVLQKVEHVQNFYIVPIVCVVGIVGNSLVVSVMFMKRQDNSSFIYMIALLLTDIISMISDLITPLSYFMDMSESTAWQHTAMEVRHWNEAFVSFVFRCFAINIVCVLSMERFIAIRFPLHLKSSVTVRYPIIFLVISFVVAIFSNSFKLIHLKFDYMKSPGSNTTIYKTVRTDFYREHKEDVDKVVMVTHFFAGPVQIFFFSLMNVLIVIGIRQHTRHMKMIHATKQHSSNIQVKLCNIFLILSLTNVFAFLPNSIMPIIGKLFPHLGIDIRKSSTKLILQSFKFCRVLNSASDFIVLLAMSAEIRHKVKLICVCKSASDMKTPETSDAT